MLSSSSSPALDLVPPFRFAAVEEGVFRGAYPTLRNFVFLRRLRLRCVVSLTPEEPTYDMRCFAAATGTQLRHLHADRYKGEAQLLPSTVSAALTLLMDATLHPLYVHCLDGSHVTGLVVLALRKLQQWSLAAAAAEYRRFVKQPGEEVVAFVAEYAGPVTVPAHVPPWLWEGSGCDAAGHAKRGLTSIKLRFPARAPVAAAATTTTSAWQQQQQPPRALAPSASTDMLSSNVTSTNASMALTAVAAAAAMAGGLSGGAGAVGVTHGVDAASEHASLSPASLLPQPRGEASVTGSRHHNNDASGGGDGGARAQQMLASTATTRPVPGAVAVAGEGVFIDVAQILQHMPADAIVGSAVTATSRGDNGGGSDVAAPSSASSLQHILSSYYNEEQQQQQQVRRLPRVLSTASSLQQQQQRQADGNHNSSSGSSSSDYRAAGTATHRDAVPLLTPHVHTRSHADVAAAMGSVQPFSLRVSYNALALRDAMANAHDAAQQQQQQASTTPSFVSHSNVSVGGSGSDKAGAAVPVTTTASAMTTPFDGASPPPPLLPRHRRVKRRKSI